MVGPTLANFCLIAALRCPRTAHFAVPLSNEPFPNKDPTAVRPLAAQNPFQIRKVSVPTIAQ